MHEYDVIVVGKGNAALCAALSAPEQGAKVAMLEAATEDESGGNSRFAGGVMRFAYDSVEDLRRVTDITDEEVANSDFGSNTREEFLRRPLPADELPHRSRPVGAARHEQPRHDGVAALARARASSRTTAASRPSSTASASSSAACRSRSTAAARGWCSISTTAAKKAGIEIFYETRVASLIYDGERVLGVRAKQKGKAVEFRAKAVVLACGGFEANPEWRTRYLGPGWELAKVRGTRFNVGDGLRMALDIGAAPYGNWSGCHATGWDRYAPEFGDVNVGDQFQKHSYIFGAADQRRGQALRRRRLRISTRSPTPSTAARC